MIQGSIASAIKSIALAAPCEEDMRKRVLVVGGDGYIGSHMVKYLSCRGYGVIVLNNL